MLRLVLVLALVLGSLNNYSYAACAKPVQSLTEGQAAPCTGYLFSPEKELEVRIAVEDNKLVAQQLEAKDKKLKLLLQDVDDVEKITAKEREKAELWRKMAESSTLKLVEAQESSKKRDFWHVVMGVGLTVLAGWSIGQASK